MTEEQAIARIKHAVACAHGEIYGEIRDTDGEPLEVDDIVRTAWNEMKAIARERPATESGTTVDFTQPARKAHIKLYGKTHG